MLIDPTFPCDIDATPAAHTIVQTAALVLALQDITLIIFLQVSVM